MRQNSSILLAEILYTFSKRSLWKYKFGEISREQSKVWKFALGWVPFLMFEPEKYRGVMCHNTEEWCKIWGGTDLCFEIWHEEFDEFWLNTRKSQNLHLNGPLLSKSYKVSAEKTQKSISHDTEEWCWKLKKTDLWFQILQEEFGEFSPNSEKCENLFLMASFLSKVCKVWATKIQRSYLSWNWK